MTTVKQYILIQDSSDASGEAFELLKNNGISFRTFRSNACEYPGPELLGPQETFSGLEDIARFVIQVAALES